MIRTKSPITPSPKNRQWIDPSTGLPLCDHVHRYRSPEIDRSVRVYTVAQESRFETEWEVESVDT